MDALVRSFVGKVHHHVVTSQERPAPLAIVQLLPTIHKDTPADVLGKALAALCHNLDAASEAVDGTERLLDLMFVKEPSEYNLQIAHDACKLLTVTEQGHLLTLLRSAEERTPGALHTIIDWHLACGSNMTLLQFVKLITGDETLLPFLRSHPSVSAIFSRVRGDILSQCGSAVLALQALVLLIGDSRTFLDYFVLRCGPALLDAVARFRIDAMLIAPELFRAMFSLATSFEKPALASLPCSWHVSEALAMDARDMRFGDVITLLKINLVRDALLAETCFVNLFLRRLATSYISLHGPAKQAAMEYAVIAARPCPKDVPQKYYENLLSIGDKDTEAYCFLIVTLGLSTKELLPRFAEVLSALRRLNEEASGDHRRILLEADMQLVSHFENVLADPTLLFPAFFLDGVAMDSDIVFHTIHLIIGRDPATSSLACDLRLRSFLSIHVERTRKNAHISTFVYCHEVVSRHNLPIDPIPRSPLAEELLIKCPISLDVMHLPVCASDGNTYEFESLLSVFLRNGDPFYSPMTRMELRPCASFNRALRDSEAQLLRLLRTHRRRRVPEAPFTNDKIAE